MSFIHPITGERLRFDEVACTDVRWDGDVPIAPYVAITFDQPMVAVGTVAQVDGADVPATIEPAVPGTWQWIGTRTLRFDATSDAVDRLPMATTFTVTVPAGTTSATGGALADAVVDGRTLASGLSTISCRDLALNAGLGNLGVSTVQFVVPLVITAGVFGWFGYRIYWSNWSNCDFNSKYTGKWRWKFNLCHYWNTKCSRNCIFRNYLWRAVVYNSIDSSGSKYIWYRHGLVGRY